MIITNAVRCHHAKFQINDTPGRARADATPCSYHFSAKFAFGLRKHLETLETTRHIFPFEGMASQLQTRLL